MGWNLIGETISKKEERDREVINEIWNRGIYIPSEPQYFEGSDLDLETKKRGHKKEILLCYTVLSCTHIYNQRGIWWMITSKEEGGLKIHNVSWRQVCVWWADLNEYILCFQQTVKTVFPSGVQFKMKELRKTLIVFWWSRHV